MLLSTPPATVRPVSKSYWGLAAVVLSTLTLVACGGGGGGDPAPPASPAQPPPNTAPTVQAGADQTITLPTNAVDLSGSATDAQNNTLTYAWTSSPATGVTFASAAAGATRVTFTDAGTYTLTLTVSDGTLTGTDTVQVVVNAAPAPVNTAPSVTAGADQTIRLPTKDVDLTGSATDAENNTLTYAWTSSPTTGVTFANAAAAATRVTFTDAGTYSLTLTANDGTATGTDSVQVVVNAAFVWPGVSSNTDPNRGWVTATPAEVGMDAARLQEAETYAKTGGGAGIITRHGKLVHKWADARGDADPTNDIHIGTRADLKSTTKSMGGIALALALDEGLIKLSDLAKTHLPSIGNPPANDPAALEAITVLQLATHTAGFEKPASPRPPISYGPPGTQWFYSDGGLNWLADLLTTRYNRDLQALLNERVWTPLNITPVDLIWSANVVDANNLHFRNLASDIIANPNAMARVGLLYLRKGMWKETRIISEASVQLAATPRPELVPAKVVNETGFPQANLNYGLLWWTNATKQLPDVPADAYWAWGLGDSLIIVIPSLDVVVARIGSGAGNTAGPHWRPALPTYPSLQRWDGNYEVLRPFLTPIAQSVTTP